MTRVWLALGGNLGDRAAYLAATRDQLARHGIAVVRSSTVQETEPVGVLEQPRFLNQVLEVETELEPLPLLATIKRLEVEVGRRERQRWGPREIDIDILRYDERKVDEPGLTIPHPELPNRPFLQTLLAEISSR